MEKREIIVFYFQDTNEIVLTYSGKNFGGCTRTIVSPT